jgi:hypothetical protein
MGCQYLFGGFAIPPVNEFELRPVDEKLGIFAFLLPPTPNFGMVGFFIMDDCEPLFPDLIGLTGFIEFPQHMGVRFLGVMNVYFLDLRLFLYLRFGVSSSFSSPSSSSGSFFSDNSCCSFMIAFAPI